MYNVKILTIYTRKTIELKTVGTSGMANLNGSELGTAQPQLVYIIHHTILILVSCSGSVHSKYSGCKE